MRCAVFLSGSGSGMEALVHAQRQRSLPHETVVVVSNRSDVEGVARATRLGIPVEVVEQERNGTRLSARNTRPKCSTVSQRTMWNLSFSPGTCVFFLLFFWLHGHNVC